MFQHQPQPQPAQTTSTSNPKGQKRKQEQQTGAEWVRDSSDRNIGQIQRVVGLDPGRKSLFTAAIHSQSAADSLQEQRSHGTKYTLSWSSNRWREASGINYRVHKTQLWFCKDFNLKAALVETPSAKVATVPLFMEQVQYRMQYEAAAVTHLGDRRHRQLCWRTLIKQQQAYSAICKAISAGSADTIVAYGDASFSSSSGNGNPSTPTVSLRRILGYHCKVFDTDEFRTSRLCCACKIPMGGMPVPVTGDFLQVTCMTCCKMSSTLHGTQHLPQTSMLSTQRISQAVMQTMPALLGNIHQSNSRLTLQNVLAERGCADHGPESYSVRLCRNTERHRTLWNRDVNAAINILQLFLDWAEGRPKPPACCRDAH